MSLRLITLHLSHFRSHRQVALAFDGRPVAFFGPNGAGKTNLLEAISLLSPGRGLRRAAPDDLIRRPEALGWRVAATLDRHDTPHEIETGADPGNSRFVRIDGKAAPQAALGRIAPMLWLTPAMDRLWTEAPEGRRRFLDRMAMAFFPDHAEAAVAYEKAMRERNRLLREQARDNAWYLALEAQMAQSGTQITANRRATLARLTEAAAPGAGFPVADLSLLDDAPEEEPALAAALAEDRRADMAAGRSLTGPHRADLAAIWAEKSMPAAQCSTGEQKALLISTVLAHARAVTAEAGAPPLLLLDEVAAHLDTARRANLYDALCGLGAHAFLTGTEPALFTPLGPRAQHFALAEVGGSSTLTEQDPP
jgi:DNA replication and repair protein RecF